MIGYIALLRGINVSGKNKILMADLCKILAENNFKNVQTYIQSGNVFFETDKPKEVLSKTISNILKNKFDLDISLIILTKEELLTTIKKNPFINEKDVDVKKISVAFLDEVPKDISKFATVNFGKDRYLFFKKVLYLYYENGAGKTKLTNKIIENKLNVTATTRNWRTTTKLLDWYN